jgi:fluoride ion exporter CrcB/FEX
MSTTLITKQSWIEEYKKELIEDKSYLIAGLNIFTNLFLGLVAVMLGIFLARTF